MVQSVDQGAEWLSDLASCLERKAENGIEHNVILLRQLRRLRWQFCDSCDLALLRLRQQVEVVLISCRLWVQKRGLVAEKLEVARGYDPVAAVVSRATHSEDSSLLW